MLVLLVAVVSGAWAADGIECSASDIGKVICTDGSIYAKVSDVPTGKTAAAMIAYIDMENKNGLALALSNEGSMKWSDAITACEGKSAVAGGTWVLPSKEQWEAMGAVNSTSAKALRDGFNSVGGTNMESGAYWSSTANDANDNKAWRYYFTAGYNWENNVNKTVENYVRACLTFNILVAPPTYSVTLAEGTEDFDKWTIEPAEAAEGASVTVTYKGEKKVKSVKAVKKAAVEKPYLEWVADQKKLVATEIPAEVTTVENANTDVHWAAGTYVVEGEVTINGIITLDGNIDLIIKDGAKLTVNSYILGSDKNLSIYGQANQSGQLVVNSSGDAIVSITTLEVHSCKVKATTSGDACGGFYIDEINVYGGSVDGEGTATDGYGILLTDDGKMNIYGGDVKAEGSGNGYSFGIRSGYNGATVTVSGGTLWAKSAANQAIGSNVTLKKGDGFSGKIEYRSDNSTWSETKDASAKYVRAGY